MAQQNAPFSQSWNMTDESPGPAPPQAGLDAIFVTDPSNQAWLTGYDGWSLASIGADPDDGGRAALVGPPYGQRAALRTCWIAPGSIHGYADSYVQSTVRHQWDLARILREMGLEGHASGWRWRTTTIRPRPMRFWAKNCKGPADRCHCAGELAAAGEESAEDPCSSARLPRFPKRSYGRRSRQSRPGLRKNELVAEITRAEAVGVRVGATTPPSCRCDALGHGCDRRASDLERRADEGRREATC
ncbi:MAG: hypothetical protein R3D56_03870 [Paracoccaceae bacterium]